MRYVYIALIVAITAAVLAFKIQNLDTVTVSFGTASATVPVSLLVIGIYLLGMVTGSAFLSLLRSLIEGARAGTRDAPGRS